MLSGPLGAPKRSKLPIGGSIAAVPTQVEGRLFPRRVLYLIITTLLIASACSDGSDPTAPTSSTLPPDTSTSVPSPTSTSSPPPSDGTLGGTQPTTTTLVPGVDPAAAAALRATLDVLISDTEDIRGLSFLTSPDVSIVTPADLARLVLEEFTEEDTTDYQVENALFELLGLMDPGTDLEAMLLALLEEQVLGFYDGETRELVVGATDAELSPLSTLTVIHELVHALTDQHFDFHTRFEALIDAERLDEAAALQALIEGDATYFELVYFQEKMTPEQQLNVAQEVLGADTAVFDAAPPFLQADLQFPYTEGFFFVENLVDRGGSAALDDAYEAPPSTTEHILHPPRFISGEAEIDVSLPPTPLPGYTVYEEDEWGELGLRLLFTGHEQAGLVTQLGDGWGGDAYRILSDGNDVALVLRYQADRPSDAFELAEAFLRLAEEAMGLGPGVDDEGGRLFSTADGYAFLDRAEEMLIFIAASDPEDGAALRGLLSAA